MKNNEIILEKVYKLYNGWKEGLLGGEFMPEDSNPNLNIESIENYLYFTLPMALNYQRNSYKLWESAKLTYEDNGTNFIFNPYKVLNKTFEEVQIALTKYKVALQKTKQTEIWIKICETLASEFEGDVRNIFKQFNNDVNKIRNYVQVLNKRGFPYLSGNKICNYWLYVIYQYTDIEYANIECLTVAPDTHVIKSTYKLGIINEKELELSNVQKIVIEKWEEILKNSNLNPIDIHTPLWLWSRNGFKFKL